MHRRAVIAITLAVLVVIAGGWFVFRESGQVFPPLGRGLYVGTINSISGKGSLPWAIQISQENGEMLVAVGDSGLPVQRAVVADKGGRAQIPLVLSGPHRRLHITGKRTHDGKFEGSYSDDLTADRGTWRLASTTIQPLGADDQKELRNWVSTWQSLSNIEKKLKDGQLVLEAERAELEGVQRSTETSEGVEDSSSEGAGPAGDSLEDLRRNITAKRSELKTLVSTIDSAQRLSPEGRLVQLSRESIQREAKWFEKALKLTAPELSDDFESNYERALKVRSLQDQIAEEQRLIRELVEAPSYRREDSEAEREGEFYNGLR